MQSLLAVQELTAYSFSYQKMQMVLMKNQTSGLLREDLKAPEIWVHNYIALSYEVRV